MNKKGRPETGTFQMPILIPALWSCGRGIKCSRQNQVVYAFNPKEGEAGKSELEDSLVYRVEFQNIQGYTQKLCLGGVEESKASLSSVSPK